MARVLDYSPLLTEPSREEVAAWRAAARARGERWGTLPTATLVSLIVGGLVAVLTVGPMLAIFASLASAFDGGIGVLAIGMILLAVLIGGAIVLGVVSAAKRWSRWVRLDRFAHANGLVFSPLSPNPTYPGAIFQIGSDRKATEHFRTADGRFLDMGNYQYTTGSGKNRTTRTWGFLALQLDRRLPHMVLDATSNNGLFGGTNLPAFFDKSQVLSLEGDFDRYFTLYCPKQYERDALYVFTPDLMALLIDEAAPYDVEIVDDWMFVYSQVRLDLGQPATLERLFRIVETVGAKTLTQTDRYSDERVGDFTANVVAPQGSRLKRRFSIGALILVIAIFAVWAWSMFGGLLQRLVGP